LPAIIVVFVILELILGLTGPMAFVQKPTAIVTQPYSYRLDTESVERLFDHVQRSIARTKLFRVIPHELIENYYLERQDDPDFTLDRNLNYTEYAELAKELGLERIIVPSAYPDDDHVTVRISIRFTDSGQVQHMLTYECADLDSFMRGEALDGERFDFVDDLRVETKGIALSDNLFFLLLGGQVLLAILILLRRRHDMLNQILLVVGLMLGLFAYVYAQNASMDYVQRFIAMSGQITLAESTAVEQLYTAIRFAPLLIVNIYLYIIARLGKRSSGSGLAAAGITELEGDSPSLAEPQWRRLMKTAASRWGLGLALLSALLYSLAFPSFLSLRGFPFLAWISMIPLLLALIYSSAGQGILFVISFGALQSLVLNYWQGTYSYISLAFSVMIVTTEYALLAAPFVLLIRRSEKWGFMVAPVVWAAFEYMRSQFYVAYPWGLIGVSQYLWLPVIQIADITGVWGVGFVVVLAQAAVVWWLVAPDFGYTWRRTRWLPAAIAGGLVVLVVAYGLIRMIPDRSEPDYEARLVLVQQNTDPRKSDYRLSFDTLRALTNAAIAESAPRVPDLIVWPEGGFKADIRYWQDRAMSTGRSVEMVRDFLAFPPQIGTWLVSGTQDHIYRIENGEEVRRNFNSSVLMSPDGEPVQFYHKIHLVPFTESFPYKDEFPWLADLLDKFDTSNWLEGEERTILEHPMFRFFTPICFEDIFPDDVRRFVLRDADIIVNMSNDYWSLTPVEGKQHSIHSLFRAVENRRPMVRATASGLTTSITPQGRLSDEHPDYYHPGYLITDIPLRDRGFTIYTRFGDWFAKLCLLFTVVGAFVFPRRVSK